MRRDTVTWDRNIGKQDFYLYVDEPAVIPRRIVDLKDYDVFLSHKGDDMSLAEDIGEILYDNGIQSYLDRWDPAVDGDSPGLEEHIRGVIRDTPIILAVVTENTSLSWWVPFEIGVARETESQIATFLSVDETSGKTVALPSYLGKWPILARMTELKPWANAVVGSSRNLSYRSRSAYIEKSMDDQFQYRSQRINELTRQGKVRFV